MDTDVPPMTPPRWDQLEAFDHDEQWRDLVAWVQWLVHRYDLETSVYPCWTEHAEVIEELTALWVAHAGTYQPGQPYDGPLRWQEGLDRAVPRLRRWAGSCNSAQHQPPAGAAAWTTSEDYWDHARVRRLHVDPAVAHEGRGAR